MDKNNLKEKKAHRSSTNIKTKLSQCERNQNSLPKQCEKEDKML
jgi:hypothetical protein